VISASSLEKRHFALLVALAAAMALPAALPGFVLSLKVLFLLVAASTLVLVATQMELYRRTQWHLDEISQAHLEAQLRTYRQTESLFSLFSSLHVSAPLPPMGGWAISPDFANLIVGVVRERRPTRVLELGSGVSTLVAGYALKALGSGTLLSLDHNDVFAQSTARELEKHGLGDFARVVHAPLREMFLSGRKHVWYDTASLESLPDIQVVLVDGPPGELQELARYPALPVLWNHLSSDAVILVDDSERPDEKKMLELWRAEFPDLQIESAQTERGSAIVRTKRVVSRSDGAGKFDWSQV
jgi:predicted O-methyltransferase YrrM